MNQSLHAHTDKTVSCVEALSSIYNLSVGHLFGAKQICCQILTSPSHSGCSFQFLQFSFHHAKHSCSRVLYADSSHGG